jgi:hypothetical protein
MGGPPPPATQWVPTPAQQQNNVLPPPPSPPTLPHSGGLPHPPRPQLRLYTLLDATCHMGEEGGRPAPGRRLLCGWVWGLATVT